MMDDDIMVDLTVDLEGEDEQSAKQKIKRSLYESLETKGNYFIVVLLAIISLLFSFVRFDNATVGLNFPQYDNAFGWVVFIVMTIVPAAIGIMIKAALRRQGLKIAMTKPLIYKLQDEYNNLLTIKSAGKRPPRSLSEYERSSLGRETLFTMIMITATTVLMIGVALSAGLEGLIKQLINFIMWSIFGLKNMLDANDYVLGEYKQWLIIHIKELKAKKTYAPDDYITKEKNTEDKNNQK